MTGGGSGDMMTVKGESTCECHVKGLELREASKGGVGEDRKKKKKTQMCVVVSTAEVIDYFLN